MVIADDISNLQTHGTRAAPNCVFTSLSYKQPSIYSAILSHTHIPGGGQDLVCRVDFADPCFRVLTRGSLQRSLRVQREDH